MDEGAGGTLPPHPHKEEEPSRSKGATLNDILLDDLDEDPSHISIRTKTMLLTGKLLLVTRSKPNRPMTEHKSFTHLKPR